jgi:two-component system cell cycle sensor histidine kinase/response regulator CckA
LVIQFKDSPLHSSVFALAATAVALLASLVFRPLIEPNYFLPFLGAVFLSAWFYGRVGGYMATALSGIAVGFLLVELRGPQYGGGVNIAASLLSFLAIAVGSTVLIAGWLRSRSMLTAALSSIGDGVLAINRYERITFLNSVAEALTGWRRGEALGKPVDEVLHAIDEATRETAGSPAREALREGAAAHNTSPVLLISKDRTEIAIEQSAAPLRDERGRLQGAILVFRDITGRHRLEEELSHAHKMEAVGRLAGGVAGEFNNVLTLITGYGDLLRKQMPESNPLRRFADEVVYAGERAAGLTRQLLAFSYAPGSVPDVVDLNALLADMEVMLRRLLGQTVELMLLSGPSLGRVRVDAAQMQQAIVNLAHNARDAMPDGGKLVMETGNVDLDEAFARKAGLKPGPYVMLAVSDTGCGMDAPTRSRLFEPFFTTKEQGKGTGLGLSLVYGTVKQADGHITVYSQVNCGTIFEIYLPRFQEAAAAPVGRKQAAARGSETVLLVDDEEGVRALVRAVLQNGGYTVIEASNGSAALAAFEKNAHKIDLVLTDVVMPHINGFELGERVAQKNPGLPILYMSGYRESTPGGPSGDAKSFLGKPFTPDTLLAKVREVLDAPL